MKVAFVLATMLWLNGAIGYMVGVHVERSRQAAALRDKAAWCKAYAVRFGWPNANLNCTPNEVH